MQVSRSIGDAYLKKAEFNREPLPSKYRLAETFFKPILSSEPSISSHKLHPDDQFLIFASDGLWEHLSNQEAVNIVTNNSPNVCFLPFCPFKVVVFLFSSKSPEIWIPRTRIVPTFMQSKNLSQLIKDRTAKFYFYLYRPILIKYMS